MDHDDAPAPPALARNSLSAQQTDDNDVFRTPVTTSTPDEVAGRTGGDDDDDAASRVRAPSMSRRRRKKKSKKERNPGLVKKLSYVTHLLKSLDLLVFAELSGLYYMECSMFRFLLRAVGQYMYLTPKDESFPFLMPAGRVHVLLVVVPNLICMLLHLFTSLPRGPDFHRGYQHGGLIIDFVGQQPATYRIYYLIADLAILVLQCLMLTVHTQREQLRVLLKTFRPILPELSGDMQATAIAARSLQDLDAEERGVLLHGQDVTTPAANLTTMEEGGGVEMRHAGGSLEAVEGDHNGEAGSLLQRSTSEECPRAPLSDIINSGNAVLGNYCIIQSVMSAAGDFERTAAHSLRTISYEATLATLQARRRAAVAQSATMRPNR
ncbi:hypothetical protein E4U50_004877 [Claviceps purpurea]|nr:hypothetical protein E4U11_002754 [Claviceps purpurea]KAG6186339.1 hypothetical protein E4U27_008466 [Claviceps purpurea]KAG6219224.1 hypothetical protein E4U50_004877 [Claviceps purpurea]KAG6232688.1 hypothetical protein E4U26_004365 [Claviceps purpurea]